MPRRHRGPEASRRGRRDYGAAPPHRRRRRAASSDGATTAGRRLPGPRTRGEREAAEKEGGGEHRAVALLHLKGAAPAHPTHVVEGVDDALGEAQVLHGTAELALLDPERALASHAGDDGSQRMHVAHIPEPGDE